MHDIDNETKRKMVVRFREQHGCGVFDAKKCLFEASYVYDKAVEIFRTRGISRYSYLTR